MQGEFSWFGNANKGLPSESLPPEKLQRAEAIISQIKSIDELPSAADIEEVFFEKDDPESSQLKELSALWVFPTVEAGSPEVYEVYTQEYVTSLAGELAARLFHGTEDAITILEVGAGSGKLSYHLGKMLNATHPGVFIIQSADLKTPEQSALTMPGTDYRDALQKTKPKCVISSWMPIGQDWTPDFRADPNVELYVLIGNAATATGDAWWYGAYGDTDFQREFVDLGIQRTSHDRPIENEPMSETYFFTRKH